MKLSGLAVLIAAYTSSASVIEQRAACNADNCLRGLRGVGFQATNDCSEIAETVTKNSSVLFTETTTVDTVTLTAPVFSVVGGGILPSPTDPTIAIPPYATPGCPNPTRYVSACNCLNEPTPTIQTFRSPYTLTVTSATYTEVVGTALPVCDPANNYGLNYLSGSLRKPLGTTEQFFTIYSATTPRDCYVKCFRTKYCPMFSFGNGICTLSEVFNGTLINPYDQACPFGYSDNQFFVGDGPLASGPCARDYRL